MFNTGMIGWRWNPSINMFQIIPYFHVGSSLHSFDDNYIINVPTNVLCKGQIKVEGKEITIKLECNGILKSQSKLLSKNYSKFYKIIPWFGGQEKAPHTMYFLINNK
jgi:hypothetical protein